MFEINTNNKTNAAYNLIWHPFSEIRKESPDNFPIDIVPKIFRTAIVANTLWREGKKIIEKEDKILCEGLAALLELFIFYTRILYDLSTDILRKYSTQNISKSFSDFIKSAQKGNHKEFNTLLKKYITKQDKTFFELKNIRDSIKRASSIDIYLKDKKYFVYVKYYDKTDTTYGTLDESLSNVVLGQCAGLAILALNMKKSLKFNSKPKR